MKIPDFSKIIETKASLDKVRNLIAVEPESNAKQIAAVLLAGLEEICASWFTKKSKSEEEMIASMRERLK